MKMTRRDHVWLGIALVLVAGAARAAQPDLSGTWRLDPKRSDDPRARIDEAAGPAHVTGGGASGFMYLPESNTRSEVERVELRDWMLSVAKQLDPLQVEQTADEVKLYLGGEENVRIFYLNRESVRSDGQGRKLRCRARMESDKLVLEESGEKGLKLYEVLTPVPANGWLIHALRFEHSLLKKPLELRLVYVKEAKP